MRPAFEILYEDNHLLVVNKPALLPTMGVPDGTPSLLTLAKDYIGRKYNKPGNVYLGIVSRLDAPVTGVIVLARTSKAAARLTEQFREGDVDKSYWAVVHGRPHPASGELTDWLRKDERHRKMHVAAENAAGAKLARLSYRTLANLGGDTLVEVRLVTGRKHQIRLQFASRDHAIVGDRKYGSTAPFSRGIALHARQLALLHPVRKTPLHFEAPLPDSWARFGIDESRCET